MIGLDVNGCDNRPEWGYCKNDGCKEEAFPIWTRGDYPDDPDLLLCPKHIGELIDNLRADVAVALLPWTRLASADEASHYPDALMIDGPGGRYVYLGDAALRSELATLRRLLDEAQAEVHRRRSMPWLNEV